MSSQCHLLATVDKGKLHSVSAPFVMADIPILADWLNKLELEVLGLM